MAVAETSLNPFGSSLAPVVNSDEGRHAVVVRAEFLQSKGSDVIAGVTAQDCPGLRWRCEPSH